MRKAFLVFITTTSLMYITNANAIYKCVGFTTSSVCTKRQMSFSSLIDWSVKCSNVPVNGAGICSSTSATTIGTTATNLTINGTDADKYCWCMMYTPYPTKWLFAQEFDGACNGTCAAICANLIQGTLTPTTLSRAMLNPANKL